MNMMVMAVIINHCPWLPFATTMMTKMTMMTIIGWRSTLPLVVSYSNDDNYHFDDGNDNDHNDHNNDYDRLEV